MISKFHFHRAAIIRANRRPRRPKRLTKIHSLKPIDEQHITFAHSLADAAGAITSASFRYCFLFYLNSYIFCSKLDLTIIDKEDSSPVTEIDRQVEKTLRSMINDRFPGHSIFGEEFGMEYGKDPKGEYLWIIDPIDGTLSYITGTVFYPIPSDLIFR